MIMATKAERLAAIERDLFRQDDYTDPRSRKRIVPMQVLNMSFPRTGTMCKPSLCIRPASSVVHFLSVLIYHSTPSNTNGLKRPWLLILPLILLLLFYPRLRRME